MAKSIDDRAEASRDGQLVANDVVHAAARTLSGAASHRQ
jgi:hypothetical protein